MAYADEGDLAGSCHFLELGAAPAYPLSREYLLLYGHVEDILLDLAELDIGIVLPEKSDELRRIYRRRAEMGLKFDAGELSDMVECLTVFSCAEGAEEAVFRVVHQRKFLGLLQ